MKKLLSIIACVMTICNVTGCIQTYKLAKEQYVDPEKVDSISEKWVMQELTFYAENTYENPFYDVTIDVIYTSPTGKTYTVPAFWDGENIWKSRFALNETGIWSYYTSGSDDIQKSGKIGCNPYSGDLDIYKHGFITVKEGNRYFTYADGTPFFYLGDTHWTMLKEEFDEGGSNKGDTNAESHFKYIVDRRVEQGFTVYQSEPNEAKYNLADGFDQSDISGFKEIDKYFQYIADKGLVHANAQLFFTSELANNYQKYSEEYLIKLTRYWVARYSAYPVLWTTAQEADDDFLFGTNQNVITRENNPWRIVTKAIHQFDPYSSPLTAHTENDFNVAANSTFKDIEGYNWVAAQIYVNKIYPQRYRVEKANWYSTNYPVVLYESAYENLWATEFGARAQGYIAFLNGMCGYGYGVGDIWFYKSTYEMNKDHVGEETILKEDKQVIWGDMVNNPNSVMLGYMKNFFTSFEWWNLKPCFDDNKIFRQTDSESRTVGAYIGNERVVIYFYNKTLNAGVEFYNLDPTATYTVRWFDCVKGEYITVDENMTTNGTYTITKKPLETDCVLEIIKNQQGITLLIFSIFGWRNIKGFLKYF